MISSSEPRRAADGSSSNEAPALQSLPSISEVISGALALAPASTPLHSTMPPQPSSGGLPSPFAPPSRQHPDSDKHSHSPQPLPELPSAAAPGFLPPRIADTRHPASPRAPPPHGLVHHDHRPISGGYPQPPAPTSHPYQPAQLPPGQRPLPGYPISPRHEHYDAPRPQTHGEPSPYTRRHYENWTYQESFSHIDSDLRTLSKFTGDYGHAEQKQQGGQPDERRLPSEREVNDALVTVDNIKRSLEQVRDIVQHTERAREGAKAKGSEENHDVTMYNDGMKPHYPVNEVKKRRGRAAPPGRCHSCNRIDTPEWRRGPGGARTLCNACGLHYAKLERKRQLEAVSLRPNTEEGS